MVGGAGTSSIQIGRGSKAQPGKKQDHVNICLSRVDLRQYGGQGGPSDEGAWGPLLAQIVQGAGATHQHLGGGGNAIKGEACQLTAMVVVMTKSM